MKKLVDPVVEGMTRAQRRAARAADPQFKRPATKAAREKDRDERIAQFWKKPEPTQGGQ